MSELGEKPLINYNADGLQDRLLTAAALMVAGEMCLVLMGASVRGLSAQLSIVQILFLRNVFGSLFAGFLVYRVDFKHLNKDKLGLHVAHSSFGVLAIFFLFYAFSTLKITEATLMKASVPVFVSFVAWFVLRESLSLFVWLAILCAFLGVVIVVNPGAEMNAFSAAELAVCNGMLAGVASIFLASAAVITVRKLGATVKSEVVVFNFSVFGIVFTLPLAVYYWRPLAVEQWMLMLLCALLAISGQFLITKAYSMATTGKVAMFSYCSMPLAGLVGWLFWQEQITQQLLVVGLVIFCAGVMMVFSSSRR